MEVQAIYLGKQQFINPSNPVTLLDGPDSQIQV